MLLQKKEMGYLELSQWYSKPASVEDKEQSNVPLKTAPLFASSLKISYYFLDFSHCWSVLQYIAVYSGIIV